jgi:hypothetical protein
VLKWEPRLGIVIITLQCRACEKEMSSLRETSDRESERDRLGMGERSAVHASSHTESTATLRARRTANQLPVRIFASPASLPLAAPSAPLPPPFSPTRWGRSLLCVPLGIWASAIWSTASRCDECCGAPPCLPHCRAPASHRLRTTRIPTMTCSTLKDLDSDRRGIISHSDDSLAH